MQPGPFARAVSIDYSDDELDAIAEAFTRRDIARRERAGDAHDPVRRAQNQTALRGLVARRAITLGGSEARPRLTLLEPHATLLGAVLGAEAIATIRHEQGATAQAVSLFVHGASVVEQRALAGLALQRMTAHGRAAAEELLRSELAIPDPAGPADDREIELTKRMMTLTLRAVERGEPAPSCVPALVDDIFYARRASGSVTITSRGHGGVRSAQKWSWIDAGDLGLWRVRADADTPIVRLATTAADQLTAEIYTAWREAVVATAR